MKPEIKIFTRKEELAESMAEEFIQYTGKLLQRKDFIFLAFSGGRTPELFFRKINTLGSIHKDKTDFNKMHFFWCDERCVSPVDEESNFGLMNRIFLRPKNIPAQNIHRIIGENDPQKEAIRYEEEIRKVVPLKNNFPAFDWLFLGIGDDGHTASIFPDQFNLLYSNKFAEVAKHPQTGQSRITLTGKVLLNAERITFMVTGENKKQKIKEILANEQIAKTYPAGFIKPLSGKLDYYLDRESGILLNS
ncbi:MAG: 6-phosphogluconolactonase [Bacteroidales bacterium]|nr:6-phosphogluconolactonase [Bacteroidales bacterium]